MTAQIQKREKELEGKVEGMLHELLDCDGNPNPKVHKEELESEIDDAIDNNDGPNPIRSLRIP